MKKIVILGLILIFSLQARAQEATLNTPITRSSETKYKVEILNFTRSPAQADLTIAVQDSSNVTIRTIAFTIPGATACPTVTVGNLMTAMITIIPGPSPAAETGTDARKIQYRLLNYLSVQGCISGVTLVP